MSLPEPEVGLVIPYQYLWRRESVLGSDHARCPRPCAIIIAQRRYADGSVRVAVVPITHSPPLGSTKALELPARVKRHLGLDGERSWIVVDEFNEFVWPGFDLARSASGAWSYGFLPPGLQTEVRRLVMECASDGSLKRVPR